MMKRTNSKRIVASLLAASLVLPVLPMAELGGLAVTAVEAVAAAASDEATSEGLEFTSNGDGTCSVSGIGTCTDTEIVIPSTSPEGDRVTGIGEKSFYGCTSLTSITIPDSVTTIGNYAFERCTNLSNILIPDSVTRIGAGAFWDCSSLESITIPDSVTEIDAWAFFYCTSLTSVTIPESVTSIGSGILGWCANLESISVSNDNPAYHSEGNCLIETESKKLISGCQNSIIPNDGSVVIINSDAFCGCASLTSITIPDCVIEVGDWAFYGCTSLTNLCFPDGVTEISYGALKDCTSLTSVMIPDSVTTIDWYAFAGCRSLESITLPDSVNSVGSYAFYECSGLKNISIPESVTSIGKDVFARCTSLEGITIPDSVTTIGEWAFVNCTSLASVTIPDSVTLIDEYAFANCTSLKSVTILNSDCELDDASIPPTTTIHGYAGSTAQTYAVANGNLFVEIVEETMNLTEIEVIEYAAEGITVGEDKSVANLFDGDPINTMMSGAFFGNGFTLTFSTEASTIHYYTFYTGKDASTYPGRIPIEWSFYGSNDGENWTLIDYVFDSNMEDIPAKPYTYEVDNPGKYTQYKIDFTYFEWNVFEMNELILFNDPAAAIPGDANGDGAVTMRDAVLVQQKLNGWEVEVGDSTADVNGDGVVTMRDAVLVQQYLNGWDVVLG